jgi:hypothetical protein
MVMNTKNMQNLTIYIYRAMQRGSKLALSMLTAVILASGYLFINPVFASSDDAYTRGYRAGVVKGQQDKTESTATILHHVL